MELSVDEFPGRGLEKIRDPVELSNALQVIIIATPETVPKEKILELFEAEWAYCRGN